ncbi:MAG: carbamoyltransferase HypF [Thalassobaculum sp.]
MTPIASQAVCRPSRERWRLRIRGVVQGVGFRPFVWRMATERGLTGWVRNESDAVLIEAEGDTAELTAFEQALRHRPPANARIIEITAEAVALEDAADFEIHRSMAGRDRAAHVLADLAPCPTCLAEMADPADRRHRYPFINCTDCGPRYSIIEDLPYDRARTAMRAFALCPACSAEYGDPGSRRFHAEPTACAACGPELSLLASSGDMRPRGDDALREAAAALRHGQIVAVKGVGGFHLMTDARNDWAVRRLRDGKDRETKPFAVLFPDLATVGRHCRLDALAEAALTSPARPILLLPKAGAALAPSVAPGNPRLGALLPYSPLHHLLLQDLGFPLVATSGNRGGEPIVRDDAAALKRLSGVADLFLTHNRPIVRPIEDSVVQVVCDGLQVLRRGRGYGLLAAPLKHPAGGILAYGGHLKTTVALTTTDGILCSPHIGDLETADGRRAHGDAVADISRLHAVAPRLAVRDPHPDYPSSTAAERSGLPVTVVQHHVAHIAACLAEHGSAPPALGFAWDGSGYGPDGTVWGGEALRLDRTGWQRVARLRPFRLPGGDAAIREPRRSAIGLLQAAYGDGWLTMDDLLPVADFDPIERAVIGRAIARGFNAPLTSSVGRLFDGIAALCGLGLRSGHEGQAATALEAAAGSLPFSAAYPFPVRDTDGAPGLEIDWHPALDLIVADLRCGRPVAEIAAALHHGLAGSVVTVARRIGEPKVVLTGGCFQNVRLTETAVDALQSAGFAPLWHRELPPNDGGLAVGQAAWATWMETREERSCV